MADPKLKDGYTQIAHEILEKLARMPLAPNQWRVLLIIIRKTYGFHLKVDYIANSQIGEATGLCKAVISRCLKELNDRQLIIRKGKYIGFQKDWEKWDKLAVQSTLDLETETPQLDLGLKLAIRSTEKKLAKKLAKRSTKVSSCSVSPSPPYPPIPLPNIKDTTRPKKKNYFFNNILLTPVEYDKLVKIFGETGVKDRLEGLSLYKQSKGKRYDSDYATVLAWERKDKREKGGRDETHRRSPRQLPPRDGYTRPKDIRT